MKFALTLLPIVAALGFVGASPIADGLSQTQLAPVGVSKVVCDGNTFMCTASLKIGPDPRRWVARWGTAVFHQGLLGPTTEKMTSMAPVPVTRIRCDGTNSKCTADLKYGDGRWVAQWNTNVFQQSLFSLEPEPEPEVIGEMAPVPIKGLSCDGVTYKCTAPLNFGNGRWVAQWGVAVFRT